MYIRRQKQRYQLIRTEYCAATKRGRQKLLGSLCAKNPSVSSIDLSRLTEQEREELNAFLVKHDREASPERLEAFMSALKDFEQYLASTNAIDDLRASEAWEQVSGHLESLTATMRSRRLPSGLLRQMKLPAAYDTEIMRMREDGLSIRKIAAALSTTRGTVQSRIRRQRAAA